MIGVFWIYKSKVYLKSVNVQDVKAIDGFIDSDFAHYHVWDEISSQNKDFYLYEYEDVPRGRIVYDVNNLQYIIYSNRDVINSDESKKAIIEAFKLEAYKVIFNYDAHYKIEL